MVTHVTKITQILETSLSGKRAELKQKQHALNDNIVIDWDQCKEVSHELTTSLNSYDASKIKDGAKAFATSMDNIVLSESRLRKLLLKDVQALYERTMDIDDHYHSNSDYVLEAMASVRYLDYKKSIEFQQTATQSVLQNTVDDDHFQESTKNINKLEVIEQIENSDIEIKALYQTLKDFVSERQVMEQKIITSQHEHRKIISLKRFHDVQTTTLRKLDQQGVRYKNIQTAAEKDRKCLLALHRRVTMLDQLLMNDSTSTNKVKEAFAYETGGDFSPLSHEGADMCNRDALLHAVKNILMTETAPSNIRSLSKRCISVESLAQTATNAREASDLNIDTLTDALTEMQGAVFNGEENLTTLINDCERLGNTASSSVTQAHILQYNDHKNKVSTLMSKLDMDSRCVQSYVYMYIYLYIICVVCRFWF